MKKGLLLIIVLAILAAGAPFGFSFWADVRLNALLDDLNKDGRSDINDARVILQYVNELDKEYRTKKVR